MKRMVALVCLSLFLMTLKAAPAFADDGNAEDVTEYTFTDANVEGGTEGPIQTGVVIRKLGPERSLIKIRTHFVPEMLKSVENI